MAEPATHSLSSEVYYQRGYWNDLPEVRDHLNELATGSPTTDWFTHLLAWNGNKPFRQALILNSGNGWVERELIQRGIVERAVAYDYLADLVEQASAAADAAGLAIEYEQRDLNVVPPTADGCDLIVNHAACHHLSHLDTVFRSLSSTAPATAVFVSWDYVGPHRNQYSPHAWRTAADLNRRLPKAYRAAMAYPHLPTMLHGDPSEAVHSELIVDTMKRYFHIEYYRPLGGALAYPLLTFNEALLNLDETNRHQLTGMIVAADHEFTAANPGAELFAYIIARPLPPATPTERLDAWAAEEAERESAAARNGGRYYPVTSVAWRHYARHLARLDPPEHGPRLPLVRQHARHAAGRAVRIARRLAGAALRRVGLRRAPANTPAASSADTAPSVTAD